MLRDHGALRLCYHNFHRISPEAWRSAQPTPHRIAAAARMGIKTIINLRGKHDNGVWRLENEACNDHNIALEHFKLRSRAVPDKSQIFDARDLFDRVEYPILMHCKSGADRVGMMAALYVLLRDGGDVDAAARQLSWRFLHFRHTKTGLLDAFLDEYRGFEARNMRFLDWAEHHLDPAAITRKFEKTPWLMHGALRRQ